MKIYNSIFDAFRHIAPASPLIQLENDDAHFFRRNNRYELIDMQNGVAAISCDEVKVDKADKITRRKNAESAKKLRESVDI